MENITLNRVSSNSDNNLGDKIIEDAIDKHIEDLNLNENNIKETGEQMVSNYKEMLDNKFRGLETDENDAKVVDNMVDDLEKKPKPVTATSSKSLANNNEYNTYSTSIDEMLQLVNEGEKSNADDDALCMFKMFQQIEKDGGEIKFSVWNKMTPNLKNQVRAVAADAGIHNLEGLRIFAKTMVTQVYQDKNMDTAWMDLQEKIKKANRMPEQMDIFGNVIYDKTVTGALVKDISVKYKDPENYTEDNVFRKMAMGFLDIWYFIPMMTMLYKDYTSLEKISNPKYIKRFNENIDYRFRKIDIKISTHTEARLIYKLISKKFGVRKAQFLIAAINDFLDTHTEKTPTNIQYAFVLSLVMGILGYINMDSEVQTDAGKLLVTNFNKFCEFCEELLKVKPNEEPEDQSGILPSQIIVSAESDKMELYNKEVEKARQYYEDTIAKSLDSTNTHITESIEENTQ